MAGRIGQVGASQCLDFTGRHLRRFSKLPGKTARAVSTPPTLNIRVIGCIFPSCSRPLT
jgi:hypothetical protein